MKKLFLGLFLMVSSSSYVLANSIEIQKDLKHNELFGGGCFMQVIVNHETPCGEYLYSTPSPKYSVNCLQGQAEGTTNTYYETRTETGWNPGSDPATPSTCIN